MKPISILVALSTLAFAAFLWTAVFGFSIAINATGRDAGVALTIGNVTQGPGPSLPKGAALHPTSITFSVHAAGSFQKLFTLAALLSDLSAASSVDGFQFVRYSHTYSFTFYT